MKIKDLIGIRKRNLPIIIFSSIIGLSSCTGNKNPDLHFNGNLGKESVKFEELMGLDDYINVLTVSDNNKTTEYRDYNNDLKIEKAVEYKSDGSKILYVWEYASVDAPPRTEVKRNLEQKQKEFESYLMQIRINNHKVEKE